VPKRHFCGPTAKDASSELKKERPGEQKSLKLVSLSISTEKEEVVLVTGIQVGMVLLALLALKNRVKLVKT